MRVLGKQDLYQIDLIGMRSNSASYDFVLDDDFFGQVEDSQISEGSVRVTLNVVHTAGTYKLDFQTQGTVTVICDRCLDKMLQPVRSFDTITVKLGPTYLEQDDNLIIVPQEQGSINVAWLMYEFVILAIPLKHVHPLGQCNKEMINKLRQHGLACERVDGELDSSGNASQEDNVERTIDPRWNELKKILNNN